MNPAHAEQREEQMPELGEILRFPLVGSISHAAHFVRANWPHQGNKPDLDTTSNPMTISFRFDGPTIRDLQATLSRAMSIPGPLIESARSFRMMLATRLVGRVIPEVPGIGRGSRAG